MKAIRFALRSFLFVALFAHVSQAQRTFVSGLGNDSNPCSRTAPCRTFAQAVSQTPAGGEVIVLDSAGYGALTGVNSITKSIAIIAPQGVYAGVSVPSGDGIDINAGASDTVILRGLTLKSHGSMGAPDYGINFLNGATLHVESCVVDGFPGYGIRCITGGASRFEVKDSIMRGNLGTAIFVSGTTSAAIDQVRFEGNDTGLDAEDGAKVTVRNSVASNNRNGYIVHSNGALDAEINIESCTASNNTNEGINSQSFGTGIATVRVSNSTVTDNHVGMHNPATSQGLMLSRGNNTVEGNGTDIIGTVGSYTAK
jgi:hypothetical protein